MARRVIIAGLRRGGSLVSASEIRQMLGRAGREHDKDGLVEIVVDQKDDGVIYEMLEEGSTGVSSSFSNPDVLAMALMPEIQKSVITSIDDAKEWCERSFCKKPAVEKALDLLREVDAIEDRDNRLVATEIGACSAKFYFHPADVYSWWNNFKSIFDLGLENDEVAPAWALGNVPYDRIIGDMSDRREICSECTSRMPLGLSVMDGSLINVVSWWYLMGGPSPGPIRLACLDRRSGFGRYHAALNYLNRQAGWRMGDFFDDLSLRVKKGLLPELMPLCREKGLTKGRAQYLYNMGIEVPSDLVDVGNRFDEDIDDGFKKVIEKISRKYSAENSE